jgi:cell division protein FtsA
MVGKKNVDGALSILACETESSAGCIRRGCIHNVKEAANRVKRLIEKLERRLPGSRIEKVYVGVGGQSVRSIEHAVSHTPEAGDVVTDEMIDRLYEACKACKPDMLDVLDIVSPAYYLDGKLEAHPVGVPCKKIEARYKLIVGRPSLRQYMIKSIQEHAGIKIAGIVVSPLALADVVLSESEKEQGCALIGFGAGVTSLAVYREGVLVGLYVIPLGGNLITKDLKKLNVTEEEAERIKQTYGSAAADKEKENEINLIIEARSREILENVCFRLEETGIVNTLGAGIVITGGASALNNLKNMIGERLGKPVRYAAIRKGIVEKTDTAADSACLVATGLLYQGTQNCAAYIPPPPKPEPVPDVKPTPPPAPTPPPMQAPPKKGFFHKVKTKVEVGMGELFKDDEDQ